VGTHLFGVLHWNKTVSERSDNRIYTCETPYNPSQVPHCWNEDVFYKNATDTEIRNSQGHSKGGPWGPRLPGGTFRGAALSLSNI